MPTSLLSAAIEDNIAWCSTVCASHSSDEQMSLTSWANLAPSPPYYPNIITRQPHAQAEVIRLIDSVRKRNANSAWGIKDSFADLDLTAAGFRLAIEGQWFAGEPAAGQKRAHEWEVVRLPEDLSLWEQAWSEESGHRIFKESLLNDSRIRFWMQRQAGEIIAGCISFAPGPVIGLSNWFSQGAESVFDRNILDAVQHEGAHRPVVFWAADGDAAFSASGLKALGKLRVWLS